MLVCLGRHCFEGVEDVGSCAWGGLWLACKGPWVQYLYIRNKSKSFFLFCVKRLRGSVVRWIFFETAVRKRSQAADWRVFFPVERTLGPHSVCACSRWGVGFRHCLLINVSLSSILDAVCYHLLGPVSLFSIFANLCFGGESVAQMHCRALLVSILTVFKCLFQ